MAIPVEIPLSALTNHGPILPKSNKNDYDKSTIVSILPMRLEEFKHTIQPARFVIEKGSFESPSILHVGQSSWWREFNETQPPIEVICSSVEVAEAIIRDYCSGLLGCDMEGSVPGLFFIYGKLTLDEIKLKYRSKLAEVNEKQRTWYRELVKQADGFWSRSNGNPLVIWDIMKLAARELGYLDRPWLKDSFMSERIQCFACGNFRDPKFPICPTCKVIDPTHPLAKDVKFAV